MMRTGETRLDEVSPGKSQDCERVGQRADADRATP